MTVYYYLENVKTKENQKMIYAYVRGFRNRKTIKISTKTKINPNYWNSEKQIVKTSYTLAPETNEFLTRFKLEIEKVIKVVKADNVNADYSDYFEALNNRFRKAPEPEPEPDFFQIYGLFLELRKNDLSNSMQEKYVTLKSKLIAFQTFSNFAIKFETIDLMFYDLFKNYLLEKENLSTNTMFKYFKYLKTFMKWSYEKKKHSNLDFKSFKTPQHQTDIIYLTDWELSKLYDYDLSNNKPLSNVRDVFLFQCYTGVRYSDILNLKRHDIKNNVWHLHTKKTKQYLQIPITKKANAILKRYENDTKPLPSVSEQKTNARLKELCKLVGIDELVSIVKYRGNNKDEKEFFKYELVSTHTARRTFVTLSLEKGMRPEIVMAITGHTDYSSFKKYIKIVTTIKEQEIKQAWDEPKLKIAK